MKKYTMPFVDIRYICSDVIVTSSGNKLVEDNDWSDEDFTVKTNTL